MKKYRILLTAMLLICSLCIPAIAGAEADVVVSMQINNSIMEVNGLDAEIDEGRGTTPIIANGRTLVPVRAIIEAFDGEVLWDGTTQTVELTLYDDTIRLVIDSNTAYLNGGLHTLDVAPTIINGRTMLPIRFVAEGFNLGVAWDNSSQTVSIIRNSFDEAEYNKLMSMVPEYSGEPYVHINNNTPFFEDYELINGSFEYYSELDALGRCDVCMASVAQDIMPTGERESISSVTPTGWKNAQYNNVEGGYLYNRCHLIGYQLTGENANERNLITGTRYMNIDGMLSFENMVDDYIEETNGRVMYRATPVFRGDNLVADGVLLEAYSVSDGGSGVSFCVYCYNVQPGISIDYSTGENCHLGGTSTVVESVNSDSTTVIGTAIYRTPTGKRYHLDAECGGKNSYETTLAEATASGLTPCKKCAD